MYAPVQPGRFVAVLEGFAFLAARRRGEGNAHDLPGRVVGDVGVLVRNTFRVSNRSSRVRPSPETFQKHVVDVVRFPGLSCPSNNKQYTLLAVSQTSSMAVVISKYKTLV